MSHLDLILFGPFRATLDGVPLLDFESNKVRALLAYLGTEGAQTHPRVELATLLWPNMDDAAALRNLRHSLANLRRLFGDAQAETPLLLITRHTVQVNPAADISVDAADFRRLLAAAAAAADETSAIVAWQAAVALVRDEFLQGLHVRNSPPWEEWLLLRREEFGQSEREALRRLAWAYEQRQDYDRALDAARQWVQRAPWNEEAQRQLIRLLALDGQRTAALAQYELCCRLLGDELGVEPAPETAALVDAIRANTFPLPVSLPPTPRPTSRPAAAPPLFVAREAELARLAHFLTETMAGKSQIAFITGEAGSGKSTLAAAFGQQVLADRQDVVVVRGESSAFADQGDPFLPFRDILLAFIGDADAVRLGGGMGEVYAHRLQHFMDTAIPILAQTGSDLVETLDLTSTLMMQVEAFLPQSARKQALLRALRQHQRRSTDSTLTASSSQRFSQYTQVLTRLAEHHPLLLILDDLQWADAGSMALLFHLGRRLHDSRILILGIFRSEEVLVSLTASGRENKPHPLSLIIHELQRRQGDIVIDLDQSAGRAFVDAYLDTEPNRLDESFRGMLYRHTAGHALFTAELLGALQERGDLVKDGEGRWRSCEGLSWTPMPSRIEAIIAERIDRLPGRWRTLLTAASVASEHFTVELLAQALAWPPAEVQAILDRLVAPQRRLVQFRGRAWVGKQMLSAYRFRHVLFQDYLSQRLTAEERVRWHQRIGAILENLYAEKIDEIALALARHFEAAQLPLKAAAYYLQAGQRAMRLSAPEEALALYGRGLALLQRAPEFPEKAEQEIALQLAISASLVAMAGWGAPERQQASERAFELCRQAGNEQTLMQALFVEADMLRARGEHSRSLQLSDQLLALAEKDGGPANLALAHWSLGETHFFRGELAAAHEHLTQALTCYSPQTNTLTPLTAVDLDVVCHVWLAWVEERLGHPQTGKAHVEAALALARELQQPMSLIFALTLGAYGFHWLSDQPQAAAAYEAELAPLMAEETLAGIHPWGQVFQGWVLAEEGQLAEGIRQMQAGLDAWQTMGAVCGRTCQALPLTRAYLRLGRSDEARSLVTEMLRLMDKTGERMFEEEWTALAKKLHQPMA